eukprot:10570104-Alexandrium_andersonii.AAC.1
MSASLVGSEMCIRDRGAQESTTAQRGTFSTMPLQIRRSLSGACPTWGVAVSYTHLTLPTICSV